MEEKKVAFIDETGDPHFSVGSSKYFILSAFIIDEANEPAIRETVEEIRKKYFQTGTIKSEKVGNNHARRQAVIENYRGIPFTGFQLIIEKAKLNAEWVKYTKTFYKFLHGLLHKDLFKLFPNIRIVVDKYGDEKYQESFAKYIEDYHIPSLFDEAQIQVGTSKTDVLIQSADFIGGSLAKTILSPEINDSYPGIKSVLSEKVLSLRRWPENYQKYVLADVFDNYEEQDKIIAQLSTNLAQVFIDENRSKFDPILQQRVKLLEYLLFNARFIDESEYITTGELVGYLNSFKEFEISTEYFRSEIIGKLRDEQVIIASSRSGLKLPTRYSELIDYLNTGSAQVFPMLARMKTARDTIREHTLGKIDIVNHQEFKYLKDIYDAGIV